MTELQKSVCEEAWKAYWPLAFDLDQSTAFSGDLEQENGIACTYFLIKNGYLDGDIEKYAAVLTKAFSHVLREWNKLPDKDKKAGFLCADQILHIIHCQEEEDKHE